MDRMDERAICALKTVSVLRSWAGADKETRAILEQLCERGYVYRVTRKRRSSGIPERPPFYRITPVGRAEVARARMEKKHRISGIGCEA